MGNPKYGKREERIVKRVYEKTGSGIEAAEAAGVSRSWAYRRLAKWGLTHGRIEYSEKLADEAVRLYVEEELACSCVADKLNVSHQWVYEQMRERALLRRKSYEQHAVRYMDYNGETIRLQGAHGPEKVRQILDDYAGGVLPGALAEEHGISRSTIENWTIAAGIRRNRREAAANRLIAAGHVSPIWMERQAERLYVEEKMSLSQVADELECSTAAVLNYLRARGVETRTQSEGEIIRYHGSIEAYARFCRRMGYAVIVEGRTHTSVCDEHDVCYRTLARALESEHNPYNDAGAVERRQNSDWWTRDYKPFRRTGGLNASHLPHPF